MPEDVNRHIHIKPSKDVALEFFEQYSLPRRVRNNFETVSGSYYRKVGPDEKDRGYLYPLFCAGFETFAQFGIGIGIYFLQLIILTVVCLISGLIFMMASNAYKKANYGYGDQTQTYMSITAACPNYVNVTATLGCDDGETTCLVQYRPMCEFPLVAGYADLIVFLFFSLSIIFIRYYEISFANKLDEVIQTTQDYSIEVTDPDPDAENPDEWYNFFSRFGVVKFVSVIRANAPLINDVLEYHKLFRKLKNIDPTETIKVSRIEKRKEELQFKIQQGAARVYPVNRIFVTFEFEEHQKLCLKSLEVPDLYSTFDIRDFSKTKTFFRGTNVLNVKEPAEPDNILWENLEISSRYRLIKRIFSLICTIALFIAIWYLIAYTKKVSPGLLAFVVGMVDSLLPTILDLFTNLTSPTTEGIRQNTLQVRLFISRLLLSTILPYIQVSWKDVIDPEFITQIISVQLTAVFTSPLLALLDISGIIKRQILGPALSETQEELNSKWVGTEWSLADRYTGIAKILFVSLFYSILSPFSVIIASVAFGLVFFIDRFLLLRRWKQTCMIDSKIATRLRQQAVLAIVAHMYVTFRFIYSWPMDEAYWNGNTYVKIDKFPSYKVWNLSIQDWHSEGQRKILYPYKICFFFLASIVTILWVILPFLHNIFKLFCYDVKVVGQSQGVPFSKISEIDIYEPVFEIDDRSYLCNYTVDVPSNNRRSLLRFSKDDPLDISFYLPDLHKPHVLSVIKHYDYSRYKGQQISLKLNSALVGTLAGKSMDRIGARKVAIPRRIPREEGYWEFDDDNENDSSENIILNMEAEDDESEDEISNQDDFEIQARNSGLPLELLRKINLKKVEISESKDNARPRFQAKGVRDIPREEIPKEKRIKPKEVKIIEETELIPYNQLNNTSNIQIPPLPSLKRADSPPKENYHNTRFNNKRYDS